MTPTTTTASTTSTVAAAEAAEPVEEPLSPEAAAADDPIVATGPARVRVASTAGATKASAANRIDIPKIGLSHQTFEGIELRTIDRGPSHWPGTAEPGQRGNTVFPGHRTTHSRPFWDIDKLAAGDEVIFTTAAGRFTYRVTETLIVGANDTWIIQPTDDATFTIFACHPKGSARQRYVVKGVLTSPPAPAAPGASTGSGPAPPPRSTSTSTTSTTTTAPPDQPLIPTLPG
ncbi:MAG TPA: class E sortase [Acidimicrobiales bacterium]|nr:class E sortase [Acidimicrobiales bacterium]